LIVTDVAGVKGSIVDAIDDPRFIGGHPMAGSELSGYAGARTDLFTSCTWVLTPTSATSEDAFVRLHALLRELDANVIALDHHTHDRLVAVASHVPHLVAGALMNGAAEVAASDAALLQLAAGGFRHDTGVRR
jgi:prephenate dehydrogenase